jgi:hypothetical protein
LEEAKQRIKWRSLEEVQENAHIATIHSIKTANHSSKKYQKITIILTNYVDKTLKSW